MRKNIGLRAAAVAVGVAASMAAGAAPIQWAGNGHWYDIVLGDPGAVPGFTWDEAFALINDRLPSLVKQHGKYAVGIYLGNPSAHKTSLGMYIPVFATQCFRRHAAAAKGDIRTDPAGHALHGPSAGDCLRQAA